MIQDDKCIVCDKYHNGLPCDELTYMMLKPRGDVQVKDQHTLIKGYRDLSKEEIDLINSVKEMGRHLNVLLTVISDRDDTDQRWLALARTDLQKGIMFLVRSIAKPEGF